MRTGPWTGCVGAPCRPSKRWSRTQWQRTRGFLLGGPVRRRYRGPGGALSRRSLSATSARPGKDRSTRGNRALEPRSTCRDRVAEPTTAPVHGLTDLTINPGPDVSAWVSIRAGPLRPDCRDRAVAHRTAAAVRRCSPEARRSADDRRGRAAGRCGGMGPCRSSSTTPPPSTPPEVVAFEAVGVLREEERAAAGGERRRGRGRGPGGHRPQRQRQDHAAAGPRRPARADRRAGARGGQTP